MFKHKVSRLTGFDGPCRPASTLASRLCSVSGGIPKRLRVDATSEFDASTQPPTHPSHKGGTVVQASVCPSKPSSVELAAHLQVLSTELSVPSSQKPEPEVCSSIVSIAVDNQDAVPCGPALRGCQSLSVFPSSNKMDPKSNG